MRALPVVDLTAPADDVAAGIDRACRDVGFFTVVGHGVDPALLDELDGAARAFFARPEAEKQPYAMATGGKAWRGWFPLGGELTDGVPDGKEGFYFGIEGDPADPRPLHGPNRFPPGLRQPVLAWTAAMTDLGQRLLAAMAVGLGLDRGWFADHLTADPVTLFRIFRYPPTPVDGWGVAEHTDYGLLTVLAQDGTGGLEVRAADGTWLAVPPDPDAFVCNLGDMLERMTGGRYRSTPHRVRNTSTAERLSFPFFLDPSWDATIEPYEGTYGEYLTAKVKRVFPELWESVTVGEPPP